MKDLEREDEELTLIGEIAERACVCFRRDGQHVKACDIMMSLTACHDNGCPLDLEALAASSDTDLMHDVVGICYHINQQTGQLGGFFWPRTALKSKSEKL